MTNASWTNTKQSRARAGVFSMAILVFALLGAVLLTGVASADSPLTWSSPTTVDAPERLASISCPSAALCVAVDSPAEDVVTSTEPTGPASAWTITPVATDDATGVSCALGTSPSKLCVTVDCLNHAKWSLNPTGGAKEWETALLGKDECGLGAIPLAISCYYTSACVATNNAGGLVATGNAGGPSPEWKLAGVDGANSINAISCEATSAIASFCVAVDNAGNAITSTEPLGGEGAWHVASIDGANHLLSVSCVAEPTVLCVAGDSAGNVLSATDPAGAWTPAHVDGEGNILGMSCASTSLCVGVDNQAKAITSSTPAAGASAWTSKTVDTHVLGTVSCPSANLCVAADWNGNVVVGTGSSASTEETGKAKTETPAGKTEETAKGKAGTPETHLIAPQAQILGTESNGEGQITTLLSCSPIGGECGPLSIQLTAQLKVEGKKVVGVLAQAKRKKPTIKTVIVASATVTLAPGQQRKLTLSLNSAGRSLLAKFKHISTKLRVTLGGAILASSSVTLTKSAKHGHKKHR